MEEEKSDIHNSKLGQYWKLSACKYIWCSCPQGNMYWCINLLLLVYAICLKLIVPVSILNIEFNMLLNLLRLIQHLNLASSDSELNSAFSNSCLIWALFALLCSMLITLQTFIMCCSCCILKLFSSQSVWDDSLML